MLPVCLLIASIVQYLERSLLVLVTGASDLPQRTSKFCSVVFGVTLRLLVINTSSSVSYEKQTPPLTGDECHQHAKVGRSCVYNFWSIGHPQLFSVKDSEQELS